MSETLSGVVNAPHNKVSHESSIESMFTVSALSLSSNHVHMDFVLPDCAAGLIGISGITVTNT